MAKEDNTPWSIIYKLQTRRLNLERVQSNISDKSKHTITWNKTAKALLNALIPGDSIENEIRRTDQCVGRYTRNT